MLFSYRRQKQCLKPARFALERLEGRSLAAGVTMTPNGHGTLVIQGTAGDDAISITSTTIGTAAGITIETASLDRVKQIPALWSTPFYALRAADLSRAGGMATQVKLGAIKRVIVLGGGGSDAIAVDTATQAIVSDQAVDSRVILLRNGRSITDFASTALPGTYGGDTATWLKRFADQKAAAAGSKASTIFLGDSMIERFPITGAQTWNQDFSHAMNLGLTGDTTSQVLYRVQNDLLKNLSPKVVVLAVGTNNISLSDNAAATVRGIQAIIVSIRSRLPKTKILLCGILPRPDHAGDAGATRVNRMLAALDDGHNIRILADSIPFSSTRSRARFFRPGNIHLNGHGYEVWGGLIAKLLDEMLS